MAISDRQYPFRGVLFFLLIAAIPFASRAQNASQYIFSTSTGTYTPITGTAVPILGDDLYTSAGIPLGFNFNFCGTSYSTFKVSSNGWLSFGNPTSSNLGNTTASLADIQPALLPLWDDLDGALGSAFYTVNGTAPNREFIMEWRDWQWNYSATATQISFQVKLFENNGVIHYIYRQESGALNLPSATIGIGRTSTDYLVINDASAAPTPSSTTFHVSIATKPATGQIYIFSPPVANNAAVTQVTDPPVNLCSGTHLVKARVNNTGSTAFSSVKVNWSVDGVLQPQVAYNTAIPVGGNAIVSLGNINFPTSLKTIKVWTSDPNNMPDNFPGDDTITVTRTAVQAPPAFITPQGSLRFCPGGNVNLEASTGTGFTYQWRLNGSDITGATNGNYTASAAGTYTVAVNNGSCIAVSSPATVVIGPPLLDLGNDTAFCETKQPFALTANEPNAHYLWSTGDSTQTILVTNQSGTYWAQVSLGPGCVTSDTIHLDIGPLPHISGISYVKSGDGYVYDFEPAGAQFVDDYLWIFSDNTTDNNMNVTHTFPVGQSHAVRLVISNQCGKDSVELHLPLTVQNAANGSISMDVYPNPTSGQVNVQVAAQKAMGNVSILLRDITGKQLLNEQYPATGKSFTRSYNLGVYAAGTYFMELTVDGQREIKRIIVE